MNILLKETVVFVLGQEDSLIGQSSITIPSADWTGLGRDNKMRTSN